MLEKALEIGATTGQGLLYRLHHHLSGLATPRGRIVDVWLQNKLYYDRKL